MVVSSILLRWVVSYVLLLGHRHDPTYRDGSRRSYLMLLSYVAFVLELDEKTG